jgi:hypothetical protein
MSYQSPPNASDVPLIELLRSVPKSARDWFRDEGEIGGHRHIPFGLYCHRAADELAKANEIRSVLKTALAAMETCRDHCLDGGQLHHQTYNTNLMGEAILKARSILAS